MVLEELLRAGATVSEAGSSPRSNEDSAPRFLTGNAQTTQQQQHAGIPFQTHASGGMVSPNVGPLVLLQQQEQQLQQQQQLLQQQDQEQEQQQEQQDDNEDVVER